MAAVQERDREAMRRRQPRITDLIGERQQGREVLAHGRRHLWRAEAARRGRLGGRVEAGDLAGEGAHVPLGGAARLEPSRQRAGLVEAAHDHDVLESLLAAGVGEPEAAVPRHDRLNAEIERRSEAPAESDLLLAHVSPALRRPVVEEREDDGLAQLEGQLAGEEHPGDVRFAHLDAARPVRVEAGLRHRGGDLL